MAQASKVRARKGWHKFCDRVAQAAIDFGARNAITVQCARTMHFGSGHGVRIKISTYKVRKRGK